MKTKRKYSDVFIDKKIAKIDKIHEETQNFPDQRYLDLLLENSGTFEREQFRKVLKHRSDISYVKGFWYGWCLANGQNEHEDSRIN